MNGSNVQAKKPICKCLLVGAAVCATVLSRVSVDGEVHSGWLCPCVCIFFSNCCSGKCCNGSPLFTPVWPWVTEPKHVHTTLNWKQGLSKIMCQKVNLIRPKNKQANYKMCIIWITRIENDRNPLQLVMYLSLTGKNWDMLMVWVYIFFFSTVWLSFWVLWCVAQGSAASLGGVTWHGRRCPPVPTPVTSATLSSHSTHQCYQGPFLLWQDRPPLRL